MILKATYPNQEAIPEAYRALYTQRGTEWVLNLAEIDGIVPMASAGVTAQLTAAQTQIAAITSDRDGLKNRVSQLDNELAVARIPGGVSLSPEDAKAWQKYVELGKPKDLETLKTEHTALQEKVTLQERESSIRKYADQFKFNPDALADIANSDRGKNLDFIPKQVAVTDKQGKQTLETHPYVKVSSTVDGKTTEREISLQEYAKEKAWPEYLMTGLASKPTTRTTQAQTTSFAAPSFSQGSLSTQTHIQLESSDISKMFEQFAKEDAQATNEGPWPWNNPPQQQAQAK